jgi:diadenosine tetraphosphate (Ap4A) HIT family hydrolase
MNPTCEKFGYPGTVVAEYGHWVVMLRPRQLTLGACVIAAKSGVTSFGDVGPEAGAEWPAVVRDFEGTLRGLFGAEKFNYLGLMLVDPHAHMHAVPRYASAPHYKEVAYADTLYPGMVDLGVVLEMPSDIFAALCQTIKEAWKKTP